jgi:hypothetical protein
MKVFIDEQHEFSGSSVDELVKQHMESASGRAVRARQQRASSALGFAKVNPCAPGLPGPGADGDKGNG